MQQTKLFPEMSPVEVESVRRTYMRKAMRMFLAFAIERGTVSIDDVRERLEMPDGLNAKCNGEIASHFRRLKYVAHIKWSLSRRPIAHSRPITLWRLIDCLGAKRWLADHPDLDWPPGYIHEKTPAGDDSRGASN